MKLTKKQIKQIISEELNSSLSEQEISAQNVRRMKSAQLAARDWISKRPNRWHTKSSEDKKDDIEKEFPILSGAVAKNLVRGALHIPESESKFMNEALTKTDKAEIKRMVRKELEKEMKSKLKKAVEEAVAEELKGKAAKEQIANVSKTIIKKLYKDLSFHHPYIIDRIKI